MKIEVKVPQVGEAIQEALLAQWYRKDGDPVRKGEILFIIETDKVTLEIAAEADGILRILVPEGKTVRIGTVVGTIASETAVETEGAAPADAGSPVKEPAATAVPLVAPSVRRLVAEKGVDASRISPTGPGGRLTKSDVFRYLDESATREEPDGETGRPAAERETEPPESPLRAAVPDAVRKEPGLQPEESTVRKPMSPIRQKIADRLLQSKQNTATLTTFNEIDMSRVQAVRSRFKELFIQKYSVPLGLMSFFIKASVSALREVPGANAFIDGRDVVYHNYYHIGVAVGGERGLVVPVIRNADRLSFREIETAIRDFVKKIRENRLEIADLEGGTFTITNGGVYGSLMSTPILNSPQSAILGLHKIEDRPVAVGGQVVIRPMMYVALSYDHRMIDGREAVSFLKRIKECIESPERMLVEI